MRLTTVSLHSDTGIGAVLSQTDDNGRENVIAFASRTLKGGIV